MTKQEGGTSLKEDTISCKPHSKFYRKYYNIKARCNNPKSTYYYTYWWRWIKCEWWNYEEFRKDMYDSYVEHCNKYWEEDTTIDRINVDWNYCKENCRWSTRLEQRRNTTRNHFFEWKWKERTLKEIYDMEDVDIAYKTFAWRVYDRWRDIEKAITTPLNDKKHRYDWKWWKYILKEIYDMENPPICYWTFESRIYESKRSIEDAIKTPNIQWKSLYVNNKK